MNPVGLYIPVLLPLRRIYILEPEDGEAELLQAGAARRRGAEDVDTHLVGGCQNYGPFLGTLNIRCRIIIGTQKGTNIFTTTLVKGWTAVRFP